MLEEDAKGADASFHTMLCQGDQYEGKVTGVIAGGVFVDVGCGKDGFVPKSRVFEYKVKRIWKVKKGSVVTVWVVKHDSSGLDLSMTPNKVWSYPEGDPREFEGVSPSAWYPGKVTVVRKNGAFVALESPSGSEARPQGMIRVKEIGNGTLKDAAAAVSPGDDVEVRVLGFNSTAGKLLSLSMRPLGDGGEGEAVGSNERTEGAMEVGSRDGEQPVSTEEAGSSDTREPLVDSIEEEAGGSGEQQPGSTGGERTGSSGDREVEGSGVEAEVGGKDEKQPVSRIEDEAASSGEREPVGSGVEEEAVGSRSSSGSETVGSSTEEEASLSKKKRSWRRFRAFTTPEPSSTDEEAHGSNDEQPDRRREEPGRSVERSRPWRPSNNERGAEAGAGMEAPRDEEERKQGSYHDFIGIGKEEWLAGTVKDVKKNSAKIAVWPRNGATSVNGKVDIVRVKEGFIMDVREHLKRGQEVQVRILMVDPARKMMALSLLEE